MTITIIIPTYNEKENLPLLMDTIFHVLKENFLQGEIIIVDDNSPDGTGDIADELSIKNNEIKVIHRKSKLGVSSAVMEGFKHARGDIIGVMDMSHPPEVIPKLVQPIIEGKSDFVIASRYVKKEKIEKWPMSRKIINRGATLLAKPLTNVSDPMSGFFFFKKNIIDGVELSPVSYKIMLEIIVKGRYNIITEVPFTFRNRYGGESKLDWKEYSNYIRFLQSLYYWSIKGAPEIDDFQNFIKRFTPYIERSNLEACVDEVAQLAIDSGISMPELLDLSAKSRMRGKCEFAYIFALAAAKSLKGEEKARAYYDTGLAAQFLGDIKKAEDYYNKAIEANLEFAEAHSNYANLLRDLNRKEEAEEHYLKAIEVNPGFAEAHSNYANLLRDLNRKEEAEEHYLKAIEANPEFAEAHSNYANLLRELNRKEEAEEHYLKAIEVNPKFEEAHGAYGLLLIELDRRKEAWREIEKASDIFKETERITQSCLTKAWFYERYSKKNFDSKKFYESGEDADKAGEEYLKAAETVEGSLKDNLKLQGNVLKARSFIRKIPAKSWYRRIYRFGKNPYISELVDNLRNAAIYYDKASLCSVGERQDVCNACNSAITAFSEALGAMNAFIKGDNAEIKKDEWLTYLERACEIYNQKKLNNGVALVDTLKQLIKCVNELAEHRVSGLHIQEERLGKCYNNLTDVSEKLDGALGVIAEHSVEAIRDYAKKEGMGFIKEETKVPFWREYAKEIIFATAAIFAAAFIDKLFSWKLFSKLFDFINSLVPGTP